jgi:hypothetical protein
MKTPTPKQVRYHYKKLQSLYNKLQNEIFAAQRAGVIDYDTTEYLKLSPNIALSECHTRINSTTEKQLAAAMRIEIMKEVK